MATRNMLGSQSVLNFSSTIAELETEILFGDLNNISEILPQLQEGQKEDVCKIENRFKQGKGYLITNGTGTGKTFIGLGIAYRRYVSDKKEILIVVPTDAKAYDWKSEAYHHFGLESYILTGVDDSGYDISITTYANFYQNKALLKRKFDLIIYDEAHYLCQNSKGKMTVYLQQMRRLCNLPSAVKDKVDRGLKSQYPLIDDELYFIKLKQWKYKFDKYVHAYVKKTKVLLLSATPFAYHKNIEYADGLIFDINETIENKNHVTGYNEPGLMDEFMCNHFGYTMKYNKLTIPGPEVDVDMLERNFFEKWNKKGVMSTRILELENDYSRDFFIMDSNIGRKIDEGLDLMNSKDFRDKFRTLNIFLKIKYNFLYINQLLESIKSKLIVDRIQKHIDLGRKVILFHSYNSSSPEHPFRFDVEKIMNKASNDMQYLFNDLSRDINRFKETYPNLWNMDISELENPRDSIKNYFPEALEFNGKISKKKRKQNIELFNKDVGGEDLIIIQEKAGREGLSLHDKTGHMQRVSIMLGLPTDPIATIQLEGRTYRSGLRSNSIFEYPTLQTSFERTAFATKIATRSKTAENLAMGEKARDLESAFKNGYTNADYREPGEHQGVGGKKSDRKIMASSDYEKAMTYYYMKPKRNSRTKSKEGVDFFATPEPLGYKMVQWCRAEGGDSFLEPSAGDGAISRFFPVNTKNTFIEPNFELSSRMAVHSTGQVIREEFEQYHIYNKFNYIIMNPPFGVGGKTAIEHLEKAIIHTSVYKYSKIYCILPDGPATNKRFEALKETKNFSKIAFTGELLLPTSTFERAGTKVQCRIVRLEKNGTDYRFDKVDLRYCTDQKSFFKELEHINF